MEQHMVNELEIIHVVHTKRSNFKSSSASPSWEFEDFESTRINLSSGLDFALQGQAHHHRSLLCTRCTNTTQRTTPIE